VIVDLLAGAVPDDDAFTLSEAVTKGRPGSGAALPTAAEWVIIDAMSGEVAPWP